MRSPQKNTLDKARDEVARLLMDEEAGTLEKKKLIAGLQEVQTYLDAMYIHDFGIDVCPKK